MKRLLLVLSLVRASMATTYYVSPAGSDGFAGNSQQPFQTLSRAVMAAAPGDTIILRDGIYGAQGLTSGFPVWINKAGTPTSWITVRAENKGGAVLDCQNATDSPQSGCDGYIYLDSGAAYWVFQDLVFQHGYSFGMSSNSTPAAHDILVHGCRFEYIGQHPSFAQYGIVGFYAGEGNYNLTFDGNVFHDIGRTGGTWISHDHGLYLHSGSTTIVNNLFYGPITGWGVQTARGFAGVIANNTFALNMRNDGGQLMLWDLNGNVTVRNNIFYSPNLGFAINSSGFLTSGACTIDHNFVYSGSIGSVGSCAFSGNMTGDPLFVNSTSSPYDFRLQPSSPAIGAGVNIPWLATDFDGNPRPQGAAFDMGAYEYVPAQAQPAARIKTPPDRTQPGGSHKLIPPQAAAARR